MKLWFLIKEGLAGFRRARLATSITVVTITLALALIGMFGILAQNLSDEFQRHYLRIHLNVLLDPSIGADQVSRLQQRIQSIPRVLSVRYISREAALEEFKRVTGQDVREVLEENPLPPSFQVVVKGGYAPLQVVNSVVRELKRLEAVDEVVYHRNLIRTLNKYFVIGLVTAIAIGITIFIVAALLIFNTIRLTIYARRQVIEIMRLVGASNFFIKGPFIVEGIIQGIIGGGLANLVLFILVDIARTTVLPTLVIPPHYWAFLVGSGMGLGLIGSYFSVGKYLRF